MKRWVQRFLGDESAAIAPTLALTLFALVAVGGIAFDYTRLAALDSELQNAADQAALAAAGQLDQRANSRSRATAAAQELVHNLTFFANDRGGTAVTIATIEFYSSYTPNRADILTAPGTAATSDSNAAYVRITVATRRANFALTPIVAAFGGNATARALAGLGSAVCNNPPVMLCNPQESTSNTDVAFPFTVSVGTGMRLIGNGQATAPGDFGFLETGFGSGASNLAKALGWDSIPGSCVAPSGVTTKPGLNSSVIRSLNTRFDIYDNGANTCPTGGTCSPSRNVRKDLVRGSNCTTGGQGWDESANPYRPTTTTPLTSNYPDVMGHPRDICHAAVGASGACTGPIGNGIWDRDAYFRVNYNWDHATWMSQTGLSATATRYQVYTWEMAHPGGGGSPGIDQSQTIGSGGNARTAYGSPVCQTPGITPNASTPDRRRMSVAVINCHAAGVTGASNPDIPVVRWVDLFLVEPSYNRSRGSGSNKVSVTTDNQLYVEVIGDTTPGGQVLRRDVPRLLE